ncbi:MAG: pirin family protein [Burkholderiales bacterium]|nr:pirin family protein [Burkholderiales bacterium]
MSLALQLSGHTKDLGGGFTVRRLLPSAKRQSVGPFLFFDHFGPVTVVPEANYDVRPHPHIGLATVTYLYEGAMMHRDSLGVVQRIEPGAINWMTAGRGITHSERRPDDLASASYVNHGLQLWAALPKEAEEVDAAFEHTPADAIPELQVDGARVRVLIGEAFGAASPVRTFAQTLYLDIALPAGEAFDLPALCEEKALYSPDADLTVDGEVLPARTLGVLAPHAAARIASETGARIAVVGGAPLDGHRFMWWNFVSSRKERIAEAARDWREGRFDGVPGEAEFIPLPEGGPA